VPAVRRTRGERSRQQILLVARQLFAEVGFAAAGTEEIARAAGVGTRGALYHHFEDKPALFAAVFEEALKEQMLRHVEPFVDTKGTGFDRLKGMIDSYLDSGLDSEMRRITLIDGPAVLGWERFRKIGADYGLGAIRQAIIAGVEDGSVRDVSVEALAHLLLVSCEEAALLIGNSDDPVTARTEAGSALDALLEGIHRVGG
jgi:AcrR family transcriptional regulator